MIRALQHGVIRTVLPQNKQPAYGFLLLYSDISGTELNFEVGLIASPDVLARQQRPQRTSGSTQSG